MSDPLKSFFDELEKISREVQLNPSEKRQQAVQFAGLGLSTIPAMEALKSKIQTGKWVPRGMTGKRFLAGAGLGGIFWGGALPFAHHLIARRNIEKAESRRDAERELKKLTQHAPLAGVPDG